MIDPYGFFAPTDSIIDKTTLKVTKTKRTKKVTAVQLPPLEETFPKTILEWSKQQLAFLTSQDYTGFVQTPIYSDSGVTLVAVDSNYKEYIEATGNITLFNDRLRICEKDFFISDIKNMSVQSKNRIMLYTKTAEYAIDMQPRSNAMKYMINMYHLKNILSGAVNPTYGY